MNTIHIKNLCGVWEFLAFKYVFIFFVKNKSDDDFDLNIRNLSKL